MNRPYILVAAALLATDASAAELILYTGQAAWVGPPAVCPLGDGNCDHSVSIRLDTMGLTGTARYVYPGLNFTCTATLTRIATASYQESNTSTGCVPGIVTLGPSASGVRTFRWEMPDGTQVTVGSVTRFPL